MASEEPRAESIGQASAAPGGRGHEDRRGLAVLEMVSQMIAGNLELETVLGSSMQAAVAAMSAEACAILLQDSQAGELRFHIVDGPKTAGLQVATVPIDDHSIAGWVANHRESLLLPDAYQDSRFNPAYDATTGFRTRSVICAPLVAKGRPLGVVQILNRRDGEAFDERDLELAQAVASLIAVAIHNAEEHEARLKAERLGAIGQTVAGMAHCIKNILNGLQAGSYIIDQGMTGKDPSGVERGWEIVRRNMRLLSNIVLDMLSFSRVRTPLYRRCRMADLCGQVATLLREQAAAKGVRLAVSSQVDEAVVDETGLQRCLINLVGNAIDACGEKGDGLVEIAVLGGAGDERFTIRVRDNGTGIPPAVLAKIFDPLFSTKGNKGTGLGLAVTRKIIEEHGGKVRLESTPGVGTVFSLVLPVRPSADTAAQGDSST